MITTEKDIDFKSLIMQTEMSLENIRYPYYETFIIFSSVKRILDDSAELQNSYLSVYILYRELDMIYKTLILITDKIRFDNDYTDCSISSLDLRSTNENCELEDENKSEDIFNKIQLTKISTDFLDSVFPTDKDTSVFIEAHEGGIRNSRKCVEKEFLLNIREGSEYFFKEKTPKQYSIKQSNLTKVELKKFMKFSCDKNVAKVIVMLFHYVSEIQGRNTRYEIILKEDGKYQIIWSYPKKSSMKAVKKYLMQQEIQDPHEIKKFNRIGPVGKHKINYCTIKPNDTKKKGIITRLMVLSCGHQLGFDLIDLFLKKCYMNYQLTLRCPFCKSFISILGCYDAIVYKCSEVTSSCAIT